MSTFSPKSMGDSQERKRLSLRHGVSIKPPANLRSSHADRRPRAIAQQPFQAVADKSIRAPHTAQSELQTVVDHSPRQLVQRRHIERLFGQSLQEMDGPNLTTESPAKWKTGTIGRGIVQRELIPAEKAEAVGEIARFRVRGEISEESFTLEGVAGEFGERTWKVKNEENLDVTENVIGSEYAGDRTAFKAFADGLIKIEENRLHGESDLSMAAYWQELRNSKKFVELTGELDQRVGKRIKLWLVPGLRLWGRAGYDPDQHLIVIGDGCSPKKIRQYVIFELHNALTKGEIGEFKPHGKKSQQQFGERPTGKDEEIAREALRIEWIEWRNGLRVALRIPRIAQESGKEIENSGAKVFLEKKAKYLSFQNFMEDQKAHAADLYDSRATETDWAGWKLLKGAGKKRDGSLQFDPEDVQRWREKGEDIPEVPNPFTKVG